MPTRKYTKLQKEKRLRIADGFHTVYEVAKMFNMNYHTFHDQINRGLVPAPRHSYRESVRLYYTDEDLGRLRELVGISHEIERLQKLRREVASQ